MSAPWQWRTGTKTGATIYEPVAVKGVNGLAFDPSSQPAFYVANGQARTSTVLCVAYTGGVVSDRPRRTQVTWPSSRPLVVPKVNGKKVNKEHYKEDLIEIRDGLAEEGEYKVCIVCALPSGIGRLQGAVSPS